MGRPADAASGRAGAVGIATLASDRACRRGAAVTAAPGARARAFAAARRGAAGRWGAGRGAGAFGSDARTPASEQQHEPATVSPAAPPGPPGAAPPNDPAPAVPARKEAATAAETLAGAYLDYWSAPNAVTLDATPDFYAPRVEFHGRLLSARALFEEKKRFVRRWPERQYTPRPDTLRTACDPGTGTCVVKTVFDFIAANPARRRRSEGTGTLELVVSVAGQQPVIIAETSRILRRGEGRDAAGDDDTDADD